MADFTLGFTGSQVNSTLAAANELVSKFLDRTYPVGSIYMSMNSTNPGTLFGGTWSQIQGRFLLGVSSSYAVGSTGGETTVTLSANTMPSHYHTLPGHTFTWGANSDSRVVRSTTGEVAVASASTGNMFHTVQNVYNATNSMGGGQPHNNMPPYIAVYMWKRTA